MKTGGMGGEINCGRYGVCPDLKLSIAVADVRLTKTGAGRPHDSRRDGGLPFLRRYFASRMDWESWSIDQVISSDLMMEGGARRRWSPEVPLTLPCIG